MIKHEIVLEGEKYYKSSLMLKKESPGTNPGASASPKLLQEGLAKVGSIK